jgi:hypothetical protein
MALHLIYGLAVPCAPRGPCLLYLDDAGVDILRRYIQPARRVGWLVVLDDQLGRSTPAREMARMIAKGYLRYDNVEVAFDPEFRLAPGQTAPGAPTGSVSARELNGAAELLNRECARDRLAHRKMLLVHQWTPPMIRHPGSLWRDLLCVQPVIVMDGIGTPAQKLGTYRRLLGGLSGRVALPGIKLFPPRPYDLPGQVDVPLLTGPQLSGRVPVPDDAGGRSYLRPPPRVIVLT